jgi:sensor histidine kinase YesM
MAWPPYAASYVVVFLTTGLDLAAAIADAIYNVVPAALWGVAVVRVCRRLLRPARPRARLFAAQVGLAACYAVLWAASVSLVFTIVKSLESGELTWSYLRSWALQWTLFSGFMIYGTIASVCHARDSAVRLRVEQLRAERLETLRVRAELAALRARLDPHFLFNTLHSVMTLVRSNPVAAEVAIEELAGLLRYVLGTGGGPGAPRASDDVRLADELAFVDTYLALEALRLGDRLRVERRIDPEALDCFLPALTLQPLVENALKHAVAPRAAGGTLTIAAEVAADALHIEVRDDGPGADPRAIAASTGMGLRLVRQRLETRYGGDAAFEIDTAPGAGFAARMRGPVVAVPWSASALIHDEPSRWRFAR